MNAKIDFIEDINIRYSSLEIELDKNLKSIEIAETKFEQFCEIEDTRTKSNDFEPYPQSLDAAKCRNRKMIEDLEVYKARLRTRVLYSPLEQILEKAQSNYFAAIQTPLRKKYGPIFV